MRGTAEGPAGAFISRVSGDAALARNFAASVFVPLPVLIRSHAVFLLEPAGKKYVLAKLTISMILKTGISEYFSRSAAADSLDWITY